MTRLQPLLSVATAALVAATSAHAVESRFDFDADGWTIADAVTGSGSAPVVWLADGRINTNDHFDWNAFSAPTTFLGDLRPYVGGSLSFDMQSARLDSNAASYFSAAFRSGADLLVWFSGLAPDTGMTHFEVALDAAAGWRLNPLALGSPGTGTALDADAFREFMGQVDALYLDADWRFGSDNTSLDNVLLSAVPEPGVAWLLAAGLLALWTRRRSVAVPSA